MLFSVTVGREYILVEHLHWCARSTDAVKTNTRTETEGMETKTESRQKQTKKVESTGHHHLHELWRKRALHWRRAIQHEIRTARFWSARRNLMTDEFADILFTDSANLFRG